MLPALFLLVIANCFMTLAWYGHLKFLHGAPLWQAILFGWMIALLEYAFMIPATRLLAQHGWSLWANENYPGSGDPAGLCAVYAVSVQAAV